MVVGPVAGGLFEPPHAMAVAAMSMVMIVRAEIAEMCMVMGFLHASRTPRSGAKLAQAVRYPRDLSRPRPQDASSIDPARSFTDQGVSDPTNPCFAAGLVHEPGHR